MPVKVFIVGSNISEYAKMFYERGGFVGVKIIETADIVVFTGGADVDPSYYGQKTIPPTFYDADRDVQDIEAFCEAYDKLKVGICRGAQFLNVMSGGSLWQDVNNHKAGHHIVDKMTGKHVWSSSTHHQMMRPSEKARIMASVYCSTKKDGPEEQWARASNLVADKNDPNSEDVEVCWYDETKSLCFQPHPEFDKVNYKELRDYFFNLVAMKLTLVNTKKGAA